MRVVADVAVDPRRVRPVCFNSYDVEPMLFNQAPRDRGAGQVELRSAMRRLAEKDDFRIPETIESLAEIRRLLGRRQRLATSVNDRDGFGIAFALYFKCLRISEIGHDRSSLEIVFANERTVTCATPTTIWATGRISADALGNEGVVEHATATEVNLAVAGRFDGCAIRLMRIRLTAHFSNALLKLALRRRKGILDRHHEVFMLRRVAVRFTDDDVLMFRHRDANVDFEQIAMPMPCLRRNDRHVATRDPIRESLQTFGLPFDFQSDRFRGLGILESDFKRRLHLTVPF
nr:hypothetical protein [Methylocapsa palsarum]